MQLKNFPLVLAQVLTLASVTCALQGAASAPASSNKPGELPKGVTSAPLKLFANRLFIPVTAAGVKCECLLDTGSDRTLLNRSRVNIKDLRSVGTETLQGAFVGNVDVQNVILPTFSIAENQTKNLRIGLIKHGKGQPLEKIDMLLGMDFLAGCRFTLDFSAQQFLLWPARSVLPRPPADIERVALSMVSVSGDTGIQVRVNSRINDTTRVTFLLDSGAEGPLFVALRKPADDGFAVLGEKSASASYDDGGRKRQLDFFNASFSRLELGGMVFKNVPGRVLDGSAVVSPSARQNLSQLYNILGTPFLKTLDAVHIDIPARMVYFDRARKKNEPTTGDEGFIGLAAIAPVLSKELLNCLALPEDQINLGQGALLICKEEYPALDIKAQTVLLDAMGKKLSAKLTKAETVGARLEVLKTFLFETEQFELPKEDRISDFLLSDVLKNKRGNCLGLSVLCLALAERVGLKLQGVPVPSHLSGPGHLLVRYEDGSVRINFDPTERGAAHPDSYYFKLFKLPLNSTSAKGTLGNGGVLARATRKELLCMLLVNLGAGRIESGHAAAALPLLEKAASLCPLSASAFNNLGAAKRSLGDLDGAERAYRKALSLQPGMVGPRLGLAGIALHHGDPVSAEKDIKYVLKEEPKNAQALTLQANVYLARKEWRPAVAILSARVAAAPKDVPARCNLGKALWLSGDLSGAEQAYREALAIDPASADARAGLGVVLHALGQDDRQALPSALKS